ncbi:hypothetical protein KFL_003830120 [Klebsormidium nitens]|uniref:Acid phosphatase/vanadium-dependent haloperoxidase-related protein n=1 Tax=Klebsormidium nitens TaxID=105231 RepID=A0A1Y1IBC2_KLENI|nr:hypothetical protein KFL_003830120 [Klebsormidium nitens]|eukprot:GAQ87863.1 hypothetical protein KFL_003830120 [Klebsormidium nitens]
MAGAAAHTLVRGACAPTGTPQQRRERSTLGSQSLLLSPGGNRRFDCTHHRKGAHTPQLAKGLLGRQLSNAAADLRRPGSQRNRAAQCSFVTASARGVAMKLVPSLRTALGAHISHLAFAALAVAYWHLSAPLLSLLRRLNRSDPGLSNPSNPPQTPPPSTALMSTALLLPAAYPAAVSDFCRSLRRNPTFMSAFIAWTLAQGLKVVTTLYKEGRLDIRKLVASGGMPSSHSSLCVALTTSVAIVHGVSGTLFPVALGFSLIVMYDAAGVRLHAGKQAEVLNRMIEDMYEGHPVGEIKLKELLGHTPLQVLGGAAVGLLVALWYPQSRFAVV